MARPSSVSGRHDDATESWGWNTRAREGEGRTPLLLDRRPLTRVRARVDELMLHADGRRGQWTVAVKAPRAGCCLRPTTPSLPFSTASPYCQSSHLLSERARSTGSSNARAVLLAPSPRPTSSHARYSRRYARHHAQVSWTSP